MCNLPYQLTLRWRVVFPKSTLLHKECCSRTPLHYNGYSQQTWLCLNTFLFEVHAVPFVALISPAQTQKRINWIASERLLFVRWGELHTDSNWNMSTMHTAHVALCVTCIQWTVPSHILYPNANILLRKWNVQWVECNRVLKTSFRHATTLYPHRTT